MSSDVGAIALRTGLAVIGALAVGGIAMALAGLDPAMSFDAIFNAAVGTNYAVQNSLLQALPITLTALGVAFAFRAGLFNLGGQGQIYIGALAGVAVALAGKSLPPLVLLPGVLIAGALGGALWGGLAGILRARLGLSEIITTIMLNFIAFWIVSYLVRGPIQDPHGAGYPYTEEIAGGARLGAIAGTVPTGVLLLVAAGVLLWVILERTRYGLDLQSLGEGEPAARFAGVPVARRTIFAMTVAGALAGLGGVVDLSGDQYRLSDFFSPNWGFDAIAVALIGRGRVAGTVATGLFFGALRSGVQGAQTGAAIPDSVAEIVQGVAVLLLIIANSDIVVGALRRAGRARGTRRLSEQPA